MNGNMTDPFTNSIQTFVANPFVLLLIAIGGILIVIGYSTSFFKYLYDYLRKPKLTFKEEIKQESYPVSEILDPDQLWDRISFWIKVTNKGKSNANESRVFLKMTDESGTIQFQRKLSYYSPNQAFQIPWKINGKDEENIVIHASDDYGYFIKIPVRVEFPIRQIEKNPLFQRGKWIPEDPIEGWNWKAVIAAKEYDYLMKIEVEINYDNNKSIKKQFIIRTKLGDYIDRDAIEFLSLEKKHRFSFSNIHSKSHE